VLSLLTAFLQRGCLCLLPLPGPLLESPGPFLHDALLSLDLFSRQDDQGVHLAWRGGTLLCHQVLNKLEKV
jgi:hypothetical protein